MNSIGIALVWCMLQVTLASLLIGLLYAIVRTIRPAAGAAVLLSGMGIIVLLSFLTFSPQPRWMHSINSYPNKILDGASPLEGKAAEAPSAVHPQGIVSTPHPRFGIIRQMMDEAILNLRAANLQDGWRWPSMLTALLIAVSASGLGWLLLGLSAVRRKRLQSQTVENSEALEVLDVVRAELGCRTPVELRQSADLITAATIGWRRPAILLPAEWKQWSPDQIRAVMAHEVAHIRNKDFQSLLCGELALLLHFYHPLAHWLIGRLRLEQELAADAAAAGVSGGQQRYLTTIAELALRQQDRSVLWPARAFLPSKTTLLRRIAMLRDSKANFERISPTARFAITIVMFSCGLLVAGLREPEAPPSIEQKKEGPKAAAVSSAAPTEPVPQQQERQNNITKSIKTQTPHTEQNVIPQTQAEQKSVSESADAGSIRVGMKKEELITALGQPDEDSTSNWLKWRKFHIDCLFRENSPGILEIRLNEGFPGALENGLMVGSPADQIFIYYGDKPDHITNRENGAMKLEYSKKGILFWTYQGRITQIVFFNPYSPR